MGGIIVSAVVLFVADQSILTFRNACAPLNPYLVLGISVLPNVVIGLVSYLRRSRAFGLTVIVAGLVLGLAGTNLVLEMYGCFLSA